MVLKSLLWRNVRRVGEAFQYFQEFKDAAQFDAHDMGVVRVSATRGQIGLKLEQREVDSTLVLRRIDQLMMFGQIIVRLVESLFRTWVSRGWIWHASISTGPRI